MGETAAKPWAQSSVNPRPPTRARLSCSPALHQACLAPSGILCQPCCSLCTLHVWFSCMAILDLQGVHYLS